MSKPEPMPPLAKMYFTVSLLMEGAGLLAVFASPHLHVLNDVTAFGGLMMMLFGVGVAILSAVHDARGK